MKQFDPFPPVGGAYGAPMGRRSATALRGRLHARRQGGGDGYDRGGSYWGTPSNVWGVWDNDRNVVYVRAWSREQAIALARAEVAAA
jgi:hypothetical protein